MKKIPSLFVRDYERIITDYKPIAVSTMPDGSHSTMAKITGSKKGRFLATEQVTPGCEWVIAGEGIATRKWDGQAVMIKGCIVYKRYDCKQGKTPPVGFIPCQEPDSITGHWPGWIVCRISDPGNRWINEAYENTFGGVAGPDGTYEAIGPKINGNKDQFIEHRLKKHGEWFFEGIIRTYEGMKTFFVEDPRFEGIVFHHPDGRMCKVKRSDFGLKW